MEKFAIVRYDNGTRYVLVMFGYDGGSWRAEFSQGDFFSPVICTDLHSAYNLLNLVETLLPFYAGMCCVEKVGEVTVGG